MGKLFKAMAVADPKLGELPGFEATRRSNRHPARRNGRMTARARINAMLHAALAASLPGIRHAFFTRQGGVSRGVYASLNGGVGSRDAPAHVAENRALHGGGARRARRTISSPPIRSIRRTW